MMDAGTTIFFFIHTPLFVSVDSTEKVVNKKATIVGQLSFVR